MLKWERSLLARSIVGLFVLAAFAHMQLLSMRLLFRENHLRSYREGHLAVKISYCILKCGV